MTPTQEELYNSAEFWAKRQRDQWAYIDYLHERKYFWDARYPELMASALLTLNRIEERIAELITFI